jgi:hypothetical protein
MTQCTVRTTQQQSRYIRDDGEQRQMDKDPLLLAKMPHWEFMTTKNCYIMKRRGWIKITRGFTASFWAIQVRD